MTNLTNKFLTWMVTLTALALFLSGCKTPDYKKQADDSAYNIIQKKWPDTVDSSQNYKISDSYKKPDIKKLILDSNIIDLPRAVAIATANNTQYQTEKELLFLSALDLTLARHQFEPQLFGGSSTQYQNDENDQNLGTQTNIGFDQLLKGGAAITTNLTTAWVEILTGNMKSGLTSILSTTITQPLLRASDKLVVTENLTQAERDTIYQIRTFNRFRQNFVVDIITQYYEVLGLYDRVKNAQNNYSILSDLYTHAQKLETAGLLPKFELEQAMQDKLNAKNDLIEDKNQYKFALEQFKISMGLPPNTPLKLDPNHIYQLNIPTQNRSDLASILNDSNNKIASRTDNKLLELLQKELQQLQLIEKYQSYKTVDHTFLNQANETLASIHNQILDFQQKQDFQIRQGTQIQQNDTQSESNNIFSPQQLLETAKALRLDLANKDDQIYDAQRKVLVAADSLRADLNLVASTDVSARSATELTNFDTSRTNIALGLDLDLPLDRLAESNQYRKTLIDLTQKKRQYQLALDTIALEINQDYRDLQKAAQTHQVQTKSLKLAEKRFKNTRLLLQYGQTNTRDVLGAQNDLLGAQNDSTQALIDYTVAMLNFYSDLGIIQLKPDGNWKL